MHQLSRPPHLACAKQPCPTPRRSLQVLCAEQSASGHSAKPMPSRDTLLGGALRGEAPRGLVQAALSRLYRPVQQVARRLGLGASRERRADAAWAQLRNALLVRSLQDVRAAFPQLKDTRTRHHPPGSDVVHFGSGDGSICGDVRALAGGPIAHAVAAEVWCPARHYGAMRLDVFLDASMPAPHLMLHLNVLPSGTVLFFFDLPPRVDLKAEDSYLALYYLTAPPGQSRSPSDLACACLNNPAMRPFISRDPVVRVFMASPAALLFTVDADARGVQEVEAVLHEMLKHWLALARMPRSARVDSTTVRQRDRTTRSFVRRDPDTANMRNVLGRETTDMLVELLSGYETGSG